MLSETYYAQTYAGLIGLGLVKVALIGLPIEYSYITCTHIALGVARSFFVFIHSDG